MTRQEFDKAFGPMTKALSVKVNAAQAEYFYNEYRHHHAHDFELACSELAMGNPGYLPKPDFFREYVQSAREMRLEREKSHRDHQAQQMVRNGPSGDPRGPMDDLFAKCCAKLSWGERREAIVFIEECLANAEFVAWSQRWRVRGGDVAYTWLQDQMKRKQSAGLPVPVMP